ncbi:MAG TPA: hypothetical protein VFO58_14235 [Vicinamibacterales bacterium]|nr:hypothetical protein [Vicinamibacterales bacterium]
MKVLLAVTVATATAGTAFAQTSPASALRGPIGVEDRLDAPSAATVAIDRTRISTTDVPIFVRLTVDWTALEQASSTGQWSGLDDRLSAYTRRNMPILLAIALGSAATVESDAWTSSIQAVAEHLRGTVTGYQIEAAPTADPREYAFRLKLAAVRIKAIDPQVFIAQATARPADAVWLSAVYAEGTAPYVDVAPLAAGDGRASNAADAVEAIVAAADPTAARLLVGVPLGDPAQSADRLLKTTLTRLADAGSAGSTFEGDSDALSAALTAAARLTDLLTGQLLLIDDVGVSLAIEANGGEVTASVPHRVLYNVSNGGTYLVYWNETGVNDRLAVRLVDQGGRAPMVRDPIRGDVVAVQGFSWDATTKVSRMETPSSATPLVVDFNYGAANQFVSRADVSAARALSVEEIVARHQRAQAAQSLTFTTVIADLLQKYHFRPTSVQVFDVVTENRYFLAPDSVEWEERSFSVNGAHWGPDRPDLPLLQAEKVLTLPLDLRLTAEYRYRLERTETVGERPSYVVAFEPNDAHHTSYRGWVWIDAGNFQRVKLQTIQTHLDGPIISNEEITTYEPIGSANGPPVFLPVRLSAKQILLIAGRNVLLEKEQWFSGFRVDAPDFDAERQAARRGPRVMFRDTAAGVRYLVKREDERVVKDRVTTSSKALAMGTTIDPTFAFPLPIFGINYLNFDFRGTGGQMALLFGGVFALGNLQTPKVGRTPFDASVDFFAIAVPGTDQRFDATGERVDERVLTIPMSTGVNLGYQFTPFQKVVVGYAFRYDAYFRDQNTADDFVIPSSTVSHGASVAYEFSRHGYRVGAGASTFLRTSWEAWGRPGDYEPGQRTYQRYSVAGGKDFLFGPFQSVHVGAGWYGGAQLDRFSSYQFGLFSEPRMHGVPAAGIRFPELALVHGSYSFNIYDIYRFDLFLDHARGRDPTDDAVWQPVTGTGVAVTLKAPWNTMFTADVGKSFIPSIYRGTGSWVLQVMFLKPF